MRNFLILALVSLLLTATAASATENSPKEGFVIMTTIAPDFGTMKDGMSETWENQEIFLIVSNPTGNHTYQLNGWIKIPQGNGFESLVEVTKSEITLTVKKNEMFDSNRIFEVTHYEWRGNLRGFPVYRSAERVEITFNFERKGSMLMEV